MKKILLAAAVMLFVIAMAGGALAAGMTTQQVSVSATVAAVCNFTGAGTGVDFGTIDPITNPGVVTASITTQPSFWCTKDYSYTITDDNGVNASGSTHRLKGPGATDYIPYTFTYTSTGPGSGKNTAKSPEIIASIAAGAFDDVPAGAYSDTVTLTINY